MHGDPHSDRGRGREPQPVDEDRRAARAARRRERAARGSARGEIYDGDSVGQPPPAPPAGRVYGARAAATVAAPPADTADETSPDGGGGPRRRRSPLWAKITASVGAVLMFISGSVLVAGNMAIARYAGNVQQADLLGEAAVDPGQALEGPINILLLGIDGESRNDDIGGSDTIIVLHVPSTHDQAYLFSVPRDTWVSAPGYWDMKLTDAFFHGAQSSGTPEGGAQMIATIINQMTGLQFNAAAIVNFGGFRRIIDEMGGIEFCVEDPAVSEHIVLADGERMGIGKARREGRHFERVRYEAGCQELAGWQALDYVRQRKNLESGKGDYGRQKNQKILLQAMAQKASSADVMTNVGTLDRLILAAGDSIVVHNQVPLVDFLFTMRNIASNDLTALQTNAGQYNSQRIDGQSVEHLTPESLEMFRAAANDTMAEFVIRHPDFISPDD